MPISVASPRRLARTASSIRALVRLAFACESRRAHEVDVSLADDALLRELNWRYRGIDRATDVLSFPYHEGNGALIDGDIVISLDRVAEQAKRFRVTRGRELARLAIHGALHLAGHDHHKAAERRVMRAREARVLREGAEHVKALDRVLVAHARGVVAAPSATPLRVRSARSR
jgi:probable rRNA maturation factor